MAGLGNGVFAKSDENLFSYSPNISKKSHVDVLWAPGLFVVSLKPVEPAKAKSSN
jgi:hypothetical protein